MFCYKCGAAMPEQSAVCPQCGTPVQPASQSTAPPPPQGTAPAGSQTAAGAPAARPAPGPVNPWLNVPPAPAYTGEQETDGKAVISLILGILAIFPLWLLAGIPAIILGHISKSSIRKSMGRLKGEGMATAGLIMGYLSVAFIPLALIIAAIAIPNLLRARITANEAGGASTVRTLDTTQVTYSVTYPSAGYASSLAVLGPGVPPVNCSDTGSINAQHACLIDSTLACSSESWCTKGGYKYHMTAICGASGCTDYVVTATPVNAGSGTKSFCSSSDAVVRANRGSLFEPLATAEECQTWSPL